MVGEQAGFLITFLLLCYFQEGLVSVLGLLHRTIFLDSNLFKVEAASLVSTV